MRRLFTPLTAIAVGAAMTGAIAGVAAAANRGGADDAVRPRNTLGLPPPLAAPGDITYAELHVRRDGKSVVLRADHGKVKSISADSITVTENDGSDVTIPTDSETRIFAGPGRRVDPSDLEEGQAVIVHREVGEAADVIALPPRGGRRGEIHRAPLAGPPGSGPGPSRSEHPAPPGWLDGPGPSEYPVPPPRE